MNTSTAHILKSIALAGLALILTAACSTRVAESVAKHNAYSGNNASEPVDSEGDETLRTDESAEKLSGLQELSTNELERIAKEIAAGQAERALATLGQSLFRETFLNDPVKYRNEYGRTLLTLFNRAALAAAKENPRRQAANPWVVRLFETLSSTCDAQLKNCDRDLFDFVRSDSSSQEVLTLHVRTVPDTLARYRVLRIAFDVSSNTFPENLELELVANSVSIVKKLKASGNAQDRDEAKRVEYAVETIVAKASPERRRVLVDSLTKNLSIWSYSNAQNELSTSNLSRMTFDAGASARIYKNASVDPGLIASLNDRLEKPGSVKDEFDKLVKAHGDLIKALGLNGALHTDEYLYVIDAVFNNHLNPDQAERIWRGSHKDVRRLAEVGQLYVRIRVLALLGETNARFRAFFNKKDVFSNSTILTEAIREGELFKERWTSLFSQIKQVTLFLEKTGLKFAKEPNDVQALIYDLEALGQNVKFFAVWPLMTVISYKLSKSNFSKTFQTWFGEVTITTGTILTQLIDGAYRPWFNFGNDGQGLTSAGVFYGIAYTLMTGLLEDFGISRTEFFNEFATRYFAALNRKVKSVYDSFDATILRNPQYSEFREICRTGQIPKNRPYNLKALSNYAYLGIGQGQDASDKAMQAGRSLLSAATSNNQAETITMRYEPRVARLKGVLEIFKSAAKSEEEKKQLDAIYNDTLYWRRLYFAYFYKTIREAGQCVFKLIRKEYEIQTSLLLTEADYLRDVHRSIKKIREAPTAEKAQLIESENTRLTYVPTYMRGKVPPQGGFDDIRLRYNRLDGLVRLAAYLEGIQNENTHIPALRPDVKVSLTADVMLPKSGYVTNTFDFPFIESEDEFVRTVLRSWITASGRFVSWDEHTRIIYWLGSRWTTLAILYKIGDVDMYDLTKEPLENGHYPVKVDRIHANEILDEVTAAAQALRLSDKDRELLDTWGTQGWLLEGPFSEIFIDRKSAGQPGLLDVFVKKLTAEINGSDEGNPPPDGVSDLIKVPIQTWTMQFYTNQNSVGRLLFPISTGAETAIHNIYREPLRRQFRALRELLTEAEKRSESDIRRGFTPEIEFRLGSRKLGLPDRYLSIDVRDDVDTQMSLFHRDTKNFFKEP